MSAPKTTTTYDSSLKIWRGMKAEPKYGVNDSLGSLALKCLLKNPNEIAQICYQNDRAITNKELAQLSVQVARTCEKLQLQQCDMVGICVVNSDVVAAVFLGCLMAGLCVSTLDPSFDKDGIKHIYSLTRPKLMFCDGNIYHKVCKAFEECDLSTSLIYTVRTQVEGVPSVMEFFEETVDLSSYRVPPLKNGVNQLAMILCSSGTTGLPKGVSVSHASLLTSLADCPLPYKRFLCFSSLYWLSGVNTLLRCHLNGATRIISECTYTPEDFFDIVSRHKVNIIVSPPSHIAQALASSQLGESDLSSIEMYFSGGSLVAYAMVEKFKKYLTNAKFIAIYGMTEIASSVAYGECEPCDSVGSLHYNREVKIIDEDGNQRGPNEKGEIYVRTEARWAGYYGNPEATKAVYDKERWYRTGDVGYFDDEGKMFIVDRKKDILKYNNFHFSPTYIEKVIYEIPHVDEVCVVGIPDNKYGYLPAAAIVKQSDSNVKESEIYEHVNERLQHFEQLHGGIYFVNDLPRTPTGKTKRHDVTAECEKLRNRELPATSQWLKREELHKKNLKLA